MTDPLHDDAVSRRYRELPAEEPPRSLDEAILASSRRAHAAPRRPSSARPAPLVAPTGRRHWYVPLAAAAVIVLAAGVGLHMQLEGPGSEDVTPPSPAVLEAPGQKKPAQVADKVKENAEKKPEQKLESRARERYAESRPQAAAREPAPFPAQNAPPPPADSASAKPQAMPSAPPAAAAAPPPKLAAPGGRADDAQESARQSQGSAQEPARQMRDRAEQPAASSALAKRALERAETPEKALERIAELRKAGKDDEADKALAEFRKRYPDFKLSEEMKAKVERR